MAFLFVIVAVLSALAQPARAIYGGVPAQPSEFPFMAYLNILDYGALGTPFTNQCGGSIVSPNVIITAAHCVYINHKSPVRPKTPVYKVRAGVTAAGPSRDMDTNPEEMGRLQIRLVKDIFIHEDWRPIQDNSIPPADIALLILSYPLEFNDFVGPIRIPQKGQVFKGTPKICGWGETELSSKSNVLLKGRLEIVSHEMCKNLMQAALLENKNQSLTLANPNVDPDQLFTNGDPLICTGGRNQSSSTGRGDSGGPLICGEDGDQYLCGVASTGLHIKINNSNNVTQPAVQTFTAVSNYLNWIHENIDTFNFTCDLVDEFSCGDGKCIPVSARCDREVHCAGGTDEMDCELCQPSQFLCTGNAGTAKCIDAAYVCDGVNDCDGYDELGCSGSGCQIDQFWCGDKKGLLGNDSCVHKSLVCDGKKNCLNARDELGCGECLGSEFRCENGQCVPASQICDGERSCQDGSDERGCENVTVRAESTMGTSYCPRNLDIATCVARKGCMFNQDRRECIFMGSLAPFPTLPDTKRTGINTVELDVTPTPSAVTSFPNQSWSVAAVCLIAGVGLFLGFGLLLLWWDLKRRIPLTSKVGEMLNGGLELQNRTTKCVKCP